MYLWPKQFFRQLGMVVAPVALGSVFCGSSAWAMEGDRQIEFSGFARVVGGSISDEGAALLGYSDSFDFNEQSLIALQADFEVSDRVSIAAQGLLHTGDTRESGLEWLYLTYQPADDWQLKLGRLRTPFVNYSDVLDVGFAYPWITAPVGIYGSYLFSNYDGASLSYQTAADEVALRFEVYYGNDDGDIRAAGNEFPIEVSSLRGFIAQADYENFSLRASYHEASSVDVSVPSIDTFADTLRGLGFNRSADSLSLVGGVEAFQLGARYDNLDYFAEAEFLSIESEGLFVAPIDSYYITLGKNWRSYQFHLTSGRSSSDAPRGVSEIPIGFDPQLDALAAGYQATFDGILLDNIDYLSVGARWDFRSNMAVKFEVTSIDERSPSSFFERGGAGFDGDTVFTQLALEWVF